MDEFLSADFKSTFSVRLGVLPTTRFGFCTDRALGVEVEAFCVPGVFIKSTKCIERFDALLVVVGVAAFEFDF